MAKLIRRPAEGGPFYWDGYIDGKRRKISLKTRKAKDARRLFSELDAQINAGTYDPAGRPRTITVGQLADRWLKITRTKKSHKDDVQRLGVMVDLLGRNTPVPSVRREDIERAILDIWDRPNVNSVATINRYLAVAKTCWRWAVANDYLTRNPFRGVKIRKEDARDVTWTRGEYESLINAPITHVWSRDLRLAIVLGYGCGFRMGALGALTWDQIDMKRRQITLRSEQTKTGKSRTVPINSEVAEELSKHPRNIDGRLFCYTGARLSSAFVDLKKEVGIAEDKVFQDFRHTFLTNLSRGGASIAEIKALGGHRTAAMVMRYVNPSKEDLRKAIDRSVEDTA